MLHEVEVRLLIVTADVVGLAGFAGGENSPQRLAVVADVEPVAHVHTVAINGNGFAGDEALENDGDELLGKLAWAVIVRAVGDERRQRVSVMVAAHEVIAGGLAGGVGRVRRVGRGFGKETGSAEGAEDFVGADVEKTVRGSPFAVLRLPVGAAGFEEVEGAVDVGGDEVSRAGDAAIDVAFRREVDDVGDVMLTDDAEDFVFVPQIDFFKNVARVGAVDAFEIFEAASIGEAVEIDHLRHAWVADDMVNEIGADEARAAGDEKVHALFKPTRRTSTATSAK